MLQYKVTLKKYFKDIFRLKSEKNLKSYGIS